MNRHLAFHLVIDLDLALALALTLVLALALALDLARHWTRLLGIAWPAPLWRTSEENTVGIEETQVRLNLVLVLSP